jgi:hypothetical protein
MNMPKFTAEASLYKASKPYCMVATLETIGVSTTPYVQISRATGPYGPIGLPGQDCYGACWHICMTFGGGSSWYFGQCMQNCQSTCSEPSFIAQL